jgi:hypothetical protein
MSVNLENIGHTPVSHSQNINNIVKDDDAIHQPTGKRILHGSKHTLPESKKTNQCSYDHFQKIEKNRTQESPSITIYSVRKISSTEAGFSVICSSGKLFLRHVKKQGEIMDTEVKFTRQEKAREAYWMNLKQAFEKRLKTLKDNSTQGKT